MRKNLRIGFTERGDGGLDLSWANKVAEGVCDGVVVVTKNLNPGARNKIMEVYRSGFPIIVHAGITGWGGTIIEPCVPTPDVQLNNIVSLLRAGFPPDHLVARIDPIIPSEEGLTKVQHLIHRAMNANILPTCRCRVSVYDEYNHVKDRLRKMGLQPLYGDSFYAPKQMMDKVGHLLSGFHWHYGITFETCAEHALAIACPGVFKEQGCISYEDLSIMGLSYKNAFQNPQNRGGCKCLGCKYELLTQKQQCPHGCVYCYWQGESDG